MVSILSDFESGKKIKLYEVNGGVVLQKRLNDMGMSRNEIVEVVKNDKVGPLIVRIKKSNIILGRSLCGKLLMEVVND